MEKSREINFGKFRPFKMAKMSIFKALNLTKLISRKTVNTTNVKNRETVKTMVDIVCCNRRFVKWGVIVCWEVIVFSEVK